MPSSRLIDGLALGLAAIPFVAALVLWNDLPAEMVIHWSGGEPNNAVGKPLATVGLYAFAVATVAFVRLAPNSMTNTPGGEDLTVLFLGGALAWVQGIVLAWNLGYRFSIELAIAPVLLGAGVLVAIAFWLR